MEVHVTLPPTNSPQTLPHNAVLLKASAVTVFVEAGHDGSPNVNYTTAELGTFEVLFTGLFIRVIALVFDPLVRFKKARLIVARFQFDSPAQVRLFLRPRLT